MKNIKRYSVLAIALISMVSCKKNNGEPVPAPEKVMHYQDSISFIIDEKQYSFDNKNSAGIGNQAINIKSSATIVNGGKLAYKTGGYYWYGEKDSTLYSVSYGFESRQLGEHFNILFTKKFKDSQLQRGHQLFAPKDHLDIFKLGKQRFAVDLEKENTMDGISIAFRGADINEELITRIPGFSILVRSSLTKDIQNNSSFEITKVEKLKDSIYLIEAKFEVNLFDENGKLYRLKKGFLRTTTSMTMPVDIGSI